MHSAHDALDWAVYETQVDSVRVLLQDPRVDLNAHNSQAFLSAVRSRNTEVMDMFLADPRFNVAADDNTIIRGMARTTNDLDLFKRILKMPNVDPSAQYNDALMGAVMNNKADVVKILLQDQRVLNGPNLNTALEWAARLDNAKMIRVLLPYDRIDPMSFDRMEMLMTVSTKGPEVLKPFLESPRVNPAEFLGIVGAYYKDSSYFSELFRWSVEISDLRLVRFFLAMTKVEPSSNSNAALKLAIKNERVDIVKLLLADERVDPSLNNNELLECTKQLAALEEQKITDTFSGEKKVNSDKLLALKLAVRRKFDNILDLLYLHKKVNLAIKQNSIS